MLGTLRKIVQEVNAAKDLKSALTIIVQRVKESMGSQVCSVYLLDPETSNIVWGNRAAWESLGKARAAGAKLDTCRAAYRPGTSAANVYACRELPAESPVMAQAPLPPADKDKETRLFLFLIVLFFPLLSIALVGGFGFIVWMLQLIMGPPGPPL